MVKEIKDLGSDAVAFQADIRKVPQTSKLMDEAMAHFGKLDIVCSNSGVVSFGHLDEVTEVGDKTLYMILPPNCIGVEGDKTD